MATFMERLSFLQKVPTLMKATADDEAPCPGYLFQEIGKISRESSGCGQCLLEYLLERLQVESCHVKLKVLKIFVHLCGHGSNHFLTELRRNSTFIQQASVYSGPPDPVHGTALYQKVRTTAQEVARLLFTDAFSTKNSVSALGTAPTTMGMGSATPHRSTMQGFGYSPGKQVTGADSILDKIQKAAEVVASAVLPPTEQQGIRLHDNHYRAVVAPSAPIEVAVPACAYNLPACRPAAVARRSLGQVGGGWEETDSGNSSSHNSSQDINTNSKSAGTRSQSEASRESSGDLSERVEALQLGDCGQEVALINRLTEGSRVFLSRDESQHFLKECSILNCEVVVELLCCKLQDPSHSVQMRALCAVSCLMTTDLLSLEQTLGATRGRLRQLSDGAPGPVANKATKILRQLEALTGGCQPAAAAQDEAVAQGEVEAQDEASLQDKVAVQQDEVSLQEEVEAQDEAAVQQDEASLQDKVAVQQDEASLQEEVEAQDEAAVQQDEAALQEEVEAQDEAAVQQDEAAVQQDEASLQEEVEAQDEAAVQQDEAALQEEVEAQDEASLQEEVEAQDEAAVQQDEAALQEEVEAQDEASLQEEVEAQDEAAVQQDEAALQEEVEAQDEATLQDEAAVAQDDTALRDEAAVQQDDVAASSGHQAAVGDLQDDLMLNQPLDVPLVEPCVSPARGARPVHPPSTPPQANSDEDSQVVQSEPPRPSLFSGMELVTTARRRWEPPALDGGRQQEAASQEAPSVCNSSQTVSAFSFLNF